MGISALIILIFFVPYTASGFSACGKLFNTIFGWDYHTAMLISAIVIIAYTCSGGFLAASFTDLIQSIVMTSALISIVVFGVSKAGGVDAVMDNARSMDGYLSLSNIHNVVSGGSDKYSLLTICSTLAWGLGYFGMSHIILRFMAIEDKNKIKTSRRIASVWVVISMAIAIFIGFIGNLPAKQAIVENVEDSETIIIKIALFMSNHGVLLAIIAGLVFAGILACTMSTSDSQLLAASSSMSENILKGVFGIKMSEKQSMISARAVLVVIAVLGVLLAALFWKRSNKYGAMAGMIAGGIMVFAWKFGIANLGGVFAIYELHPAFLTALIAIVVVSLATSAPEKEIENEYDKVLEEIDK